MWPKSASGAQFIFFVRIYEDLKKLRRLEDNFHFENMEIVEFTWILLTNDASLSARISLHTRSELTSRVLVGFVVCWQFLKAEMLSFLKYVLIFKLNTFS